MALSHDCLGVVLAGGLSTRMGKNKAMLQRNHEDMLNYSQQLLKQCNVDNVVVSGNSYDVADQYPALGPLSGIYSVIQAKKPSAILALPVDLPLLTAKALGKLKQIGELSQQAVCYEHHYLPLYLPVNAYSELFLSQQFKQAKVLNSNKGPSIRRFIEAIPHRCLPLENEQHLFNCNTPTQWQQAKNIFTAARL